MDTTRTPRSKRFERLEARDINREVYVRELPELGLIVMNSPTDPQPSLEIQDGRVVEMDGRGVEEFDAIDRFIAGHAINLERAGAAMARGSLEIARMLVDINVPRREVMDVFSGLTPAMIAEVMSHLNVVEMMMAMQKMRQRRRPFDQAHVTNWKENPALLAADAAEAGLRGFAEEETTVRVARMAPFSALALLVGSQTGRPGVMTQISCEEALNLRLAMKGLATYAETLSVYGTIPSFLDGDDTPVVEGHSRLRICLARREVALHVRLGFRGPHGLRDGPVDALSRNPLPPDGQGRGQPGRPERLHLVHCPSGKPSGRGARGPGREPGGGGTRTRGRGRQRRHGLPQPDAEDGKADAADAAGNGLHHIGPFGDAAQGQSLRRRQLRCGGHGRLAGHPARHAGRRRPAAGP